MERSPDDPQIEFFINLYLFCILVVKCQLEKIILKSKLKKRLEARDVIRAIVPILQLLSIKNDSSRLTPFRDFVLCRIAFNTVDCPTRTRFCSPRSVHFRPCKLFNMK